MQAVELRPEGIRELLVLQAGMHGQLCVFKVPSPYRVENGLRRGKATVRRVVMVSKVTSVLNPLLAEGWDEWVDLNHVQGGK